MATIGFGPAVTDVAAAAVAAAAAVISSWQTWLASPLLKKKNCRFSSAQNFFHCGEKDPCPFPVDLWPVGK